MDRRLITIGMLVAAGAVGGAQPAADPALTGALDKLAAYVSAYGEKAALIVAVEKYTQTVMFEGAQTPAQPRRLVAEFAIVKTGDGSGWVGFRDVVEVNGKPLSDRRDRLMSLFTSKANTDAGEVTRIANESARFNVGPVSRNFNVPTTAMFFFLPEHSRASSSRARDPGGSTASTRGRSPSRKPVPPHLSRLGPGSTCRCLAPSGSRLTTGLLCGRGCA